MTTINNSGLTNYLSNATAIIEKKLIAPLTSQQKKIIVIFAAAVSCLICLIACASWSFKKKKPSKTESITSQEKPRETKPAGGKDADQTQRAQNRTPAEGTRRKPAEVRTNDRAAANPDEDSSNRRVRTLRQMSPEEQAKFLKAEILKNLANSAVGAAQKGLNPVDSSLKQRNARTDDESIEESSINGRVKVKVAKIEIKTQKAEVEVAQDELNIAKTASAAAEFKWKQAKKKLEEAQAKVLDTTDQTQAQFKNASVLLKNAKNEVNKSKTKLDKSLAKTIAAKKKVSALSIQENRV